MSKSYTGRDPSTGELLTVHCTGGHITAIDRGGVDEGLWLAPGLIDLQVNGYGGHDVNAGDLTPEAIHGLAHALLATGVTTFLPTLITASEEKLIHNLRIIASARKADPLLAHMIPLVHIEGPHISPKDGPRGAHPREHVRPPDLAEFLRWQAASGDLVGMVTLSPHYPGAPAYIHALSARGIHLSLGHTGGNAGQIQAAVDAGARLSTHLGNGVASTLPRHPNLLWAQLAEDRLTATFIADGHHLPADTLTAMLRAKSVPRAILVSDLVSVAGLAPGKYQTAVGGTVDLRPDGRLTLAGTEYLAGSTSTLRDAIAYVAAHTGFSLGDAVQMATANPGRFTGTRGQLRAGAPADLIRFRCEPGCSTLAIEDVVLQGHRR